MSTTPSLSAAQVKRMTHYVELFCEQEYLTEQHLYQDVLEFAVAITKSEIGYLHLYDEKTEELILNVWSKKVLAMCTTVHDGHYPLQSAGIWADCIRQRQPVIHNNYAEYARHSQLPLGHFPLQRHMSIPIFFAEKMVAIIGVGNRVSPYTENDAHQLVVFGQRIWSLLTVRLTQIQTRLQVEGSILKNLQPEDIFVQIIEAVSRALELRDRYTASHQANVANIADAIAQRLGLSEEARLGIRLGALVHDIGKIAIPVEILTKPGKLNAAELELLKTHAQIGAEVFEGMRFPWPIHDMILQHHERLDGSGYPYRLQGNMITLEAKIIAVADVFDAMSSDRPYRHKRSLSETVEYIATGRGKQFDAYVVDAFLAYLEQEREI